MIIFVVLLLKAKIYIYVKIAQGSGINKIALLEDSAQILLFL